MAKRTDTRVIVTLSVFVVLTIILSFWGFNSSQVETDNQASNGFSIEAYINQKKNQLSKADLTVINAIETSINDSRGTQKSELISNLAKKWELLGDLPIAAHYKQEVAHQVSTKENWETAANSLFNSIGTIQDSAMAEHFYNATEEAYNHLLEIDPNNEQGKINLAVCLIDHKEQVMQGVQLLKQVVAYNDSNEQALYILGVLSIRSTQYDKAIERFEKLVSLQPENPDYHMMLGNVLSTTGETEKAIQHYETAKSLYTDDESVERVNNIIKDIKRN